MTERSYHAPALEKGIEILEILSQQTEPKSNHAIAADLGRSTAEIYRMLITLERKGYIVRAENGGYLLTNRLFELAMRAKGAN